MAEDPSPRPPHPSPGEPAVGAPGEPRTRPFLSALPDRLRRTDPALLRLLLFVGALVAVLYVLIAFSNVFLPLLLGLAIAYILDPAVGWLERRRVPRLWGTVILSLVLVLLATGFFFYLVPQMNEQFRRMGDRLPEYTERIQETTAPLLERARARYPQQVEDLRARAIESVRENLPRITEMVTDAVQNLFSTLLGFVLFLLNLIFVPVFAFYLLVDFPKVKRQTIGLVPLPYRDLVLARVREVDQAVSSFLRGQLTIALILAAINSIGLMILDVPLGLLIGIVAGLANMIPYMSLVVGLVPALLFSWVEHQSLANMIGVVVVFTAAQLLEGTFLSPRILGKSVNLHPVWVLLAILIGGSTLGFFGMLIAVPAAAAIQVFVRHWRTSYQRSKIYLGEDPAAGSGEDYPPDPIDPVASSTSRSTLST